MKDADRQFRRSEFYANLFGWIDGNGQKKTPALHFIDEIKWAIVSPNTEFNQLKRDLETLSCGKKLETKGEKRCRSLSTPRNLSQTRIPPPDAASPVQMACQLSLVYLIVIEEFLDN